MSEAGFTKGPWALLPLEDDKEYIRVRGTVCGGKYKIANVVDCRSHHDGSKWCEFRRAESKANAHLIAAAPELYDFIEDLSQNSEDVTQREEAKRLLAKARGEV